MTLVYIIFGAWLVFAAGVMRWALSAKEEWRIVEKYPRSVRTRILVSSFEHWRHEIDEPHRERVAELVKGLRWRYSVLFFIIPALLIAAFWRTL